jgi:hypothetical protein
LAVEMALPRVRSVERERLCWQGIRDVGSKGKSTSTTGVAVATEYMFSQCKRVNKKN